MKNLVLFFSGCFILISCSNRNDIDNIISNEYEKCDSKTNCIVDLAVSMNFEWDTMCYYSGAYSLEEINQDLGFDLKQFTDIGDRVIFLSKGNIVYQKEWFPNPSEPKIGTVFKTDLKKFRVSKLDARFRINKEGQVFFLTKL